ncbi:MAG: cysteine desulfurase NifS [Actinobacteria bacterium RBG_19FT_COMBO_54_7]|uniref:cysteine desulfurase n=1 Tax=Candidatus Solincola sediminis TaxID=1797199 RepID=A0A1F2WN82_9ACTN|nr:MAG: cysteine desulfurase NifS [Candidatus Solincola sediminis]OFW60193.1 MAG: cysteine desulfurase NifS [Candidatus Solincola sediminis]OFW65179.1 MAG: cysteine desulfurase NifS [Actinobacteria bacterium RBG_19FT_COMBO_54_7]
MDWIYLDYNASTPIDTSVRDAVVPYLEKAYGNPSSTHWAGIPARQAIDDARSKVADLFGCSHDEIVFTSGGTEANNHALKGVFFANGARGHFITSAVEHPAIVEPLRFLETLGAEITIVPVDRFGMVDPADVLDAIKSDTLLVSVMHANNEVGTIQPIKEISAICRNAGVLLHTDAAQSVGKIPSGVNELGVDLMSIAAHKFYGPKGIGALYIKNRIRLESFMHGAGHEAGRRAGTENIPLVVGLGQAALLAKDLEPMFRVAQLRDLFWSRLIAVFDERIVLNGHPEQRLPNTLNVSFLGHVGAEVLAAMPEVAATTGSACHSGSVEMSPVLKAMNTPEDVAAGTIRFSLGRMTRDSDIEQVVGRLKNIIG